MRPGAFIYLLVWTIVGYLIATSIASAIGDLVSPARSNWVPFALIEALTGNPLVVYEPDKSTLLEKAIFTGYLTAIFFLNPLLFCSFINFFIHTIPLARLDQALIVRPLVSLLPVCNVYFLIRAFLRTNIENKTGRVVFSVGAGIAFTHSPVLWIDALNLNGTDFSGFYLYFSGIAALGTIAAILSLVYNSPKEANASE